MFVEICLKNILGSRIFKPYNLSVNILKFLGGKTNLNKRLVSITLIFAMLLTFFVPYVPKAEAVTDSLTFLPVGQSEEGIMLQWKTNSSSGDKESFILLKGEEEISLPSVEVLESKEDSSGQFNRTYQFLDKNVEENTTYSYTIIRHGEKAVQSEPIEVTYKQNVDNKLGLNPTISNITGDSFVVSWESIDQVDSYQLLVNGKMVEQFDKATDYELTDLKEQTNYSVSIRAIQDDQIKIEELKKVTTASVEQPKNEVENEPISGVEKQINYASTGEIVSIPDSSLKRVIKKKLGLESDQIYVADLERLTELEASYQGIKNLTGLEKAVNLSKLELAGNELRSAHAIKELKNLEYLDLSFYSGDSYEFLSSLPSLKTLILAESSISSLVPMENLTNLETLDVSFSKVSTLEPIASLHKLVDLNISYVKLETISPLESLTNLSTLTMYGGSYFTLKDEVTELKNRGVEILHDDFYNLYLSSIKANENRAILKWEYEGGENVDYYEIKLGERVIKIDSDQNSYTLSDLSANTEFQVEMMAYNDENQVIGQANATFKTLPNATGEKVVFNDPNLVRAIKAHFGLERDLVESDMLELKELDIERKRIKDLKGLETAINLETLYASSNAIEDITPLSTLSSLQSLYLDGNPIKDFTPLKSMTTLTGLNLSNTGIQDLSVLANMQKLVDLALDENHLVSLSTLPVLESLIYLSLVGNELKNLNGIEKVKQVESLYIDTNPVESLIGIEQLSNLKDLSASQTSIYQIDSLLDLPNLEFVSIYANENLDLTEGSPSREVIQQLEDRGIYVDYEYTDSEWFELYVSSITEHSMNLTIDYYGEKVIQKYEVLVNGKLSQTLTSEETDIRLEGLEADTEYEIEVKAYSGGEVYLSNVVTEKTWPEPTGSVVSFKDNQLKELIKGYLGLERDLVESDMERLDSLYLSDTNIDDLTGLEYATNLFELYVSGNSKKLDLSPLANLSNLSFVYIENTPIKDYSVLASIKNVQSLSIVNNELQDLSFLKGMSRLNDITLMKNKITDISAFSSLKKLYFVNLAHNQIEDLSPLKATKDQLYYLDVTGNPISDISHLTQFENLYYLILDETKITDLSYLLELLNLESVSLYNIATLDLSEGSRNQQIIKELTDLGVFVNLEVDSTPELYVEEVTEKSISVSWDPMLPKGLGTYKLLLYYNNGEELLEEYEISSSETSYQFTNLLANTDYYIEVIAEEEEYFGYVSANAKTLAKEGSVKDVNMYVYETKDVPKADASFSLYGTNSDTDDTFIFGRSDQEGKLWNDVGEEPIDVFSLPVGSYEITFISDNEEISLQFDIQDDEDYLANPLRFVLKEDNVITPLPDKGKGEGKDEEKESPTAPEEKEEPIKVRNLEKNKKTKEESQQELPKTATEFYNLILVGGLLISMGGAILYLQRKKRVKNSL